MPLFSFWTIPYVSIDDTRLVYLYNIGFICIIGSLFSSIFLQMAYLDSENLHGITEARIKTPSDWSPDTSDQFCKENLCVKWDAFEVGYSYTSDSVFVTTRVIDSLENSTCSKEKKEEFRLLGNINEDENNNAESDDEPSDSAHGDEVLECAEYRRISKKKYYPHGVDNLFLVVDANAEALQFCSSSVFEPNNQNMEGGQTCPYIYTMRDTHGELLSYNETVLRHFTNSKKEEKSRKEVPVSAYLEAAGVSSLSDWKLRDRGGVFLITIQFHLDHSKLGFLTGLLTNPDQEKLPTKYSIKVKRLAKAGYKVTIFQYLLP